MKKVLLSMCVFSFCVTTLCAQGKSFGFENNTFGRGTVAVNLGMGLFSPYNDNLGAFSFPPPLSASVDLCIVDNLFNEKSALGVGGYFGYYGQRFKELGESVGLNYFIFGGRVHLHYQFLSKLDTYGGSTLGYQLLSMGLGEYGTPSEGRFYWSGFVGARYYFSSHLGVFGEFGNGMAYTTLGLTLKF